MGAEQVGERPTPVDVTDDVDGQPCRLRQTEIGHIRGPQIDLSRGSRPLAHHDVKAFPQTCQLCHRDAP